METVVEMDQEKETEYAPFFLRGLAALMEALVFMAISIPLALFLPMLITKIDASIFVPQIPGFFFMEGLLPGIAFPFFIELAKQHIHARDVAGPTESSTFIWMCTIGSLVLVNLLYHVIMEISPLQGTVGKLVVGMKVTTVNGKRPGLLAVLLRHATRLLSMLLLFGGYAMALKSAKKQTLHDKLSGCLVVKTSP